LVEPDPEGAQFYAATAARDLAWVAGEERVMAAATCSHECRFAAMCSAGVANHLPVGPTGERTSDPKQTIMSGESRAQANLVREVFAGPWGGPSVILLPMWLRWRDSLVRQFARTIYEEGRFEDLPMLGDALEEAGCDDALLVEHCRRKNDHVRGCWALDLILGKE
jgi:hypothetical protein